MFSFLLCDLAEICRRFGATLSCMDCKTEAVCFTETSSNLQESMNDILESGSFNSHHRNLRPGQALRVPGG